jgi:hypothetical protein
VRWALLASGFAVALCTIYAGVLFGGKTFVLRDALQYTLPSREFLARTLSHGRIPEWWDGVGFGVAFAANPVHGLASPLSWPLALAPSSWAFDLRSFCELLLLALGTAALARKLGAGWPGAFFSGVTAMLSGYAVSGIPNGYIPYIVWIPWVAFAALLRVEAAATADPRERARAGALFAGAVALQLVSGEPGHVLVAALGVLTLVLAEGPIWRRLRSLLLPAAGGVALAAVAILPALALLGQSARAHLSGTGHLQWSMHPARILEWIWPLPFGSKGNESWYAGAVLDLPLGELFFALSLYVGVPVLLLAGAAAGDKRIRRLLIASIVFVVLALGSYTPIYGALRAVFPPLRVVNFPEKFFFGALLLWCVAAGVGLTRVLGAAPPSRWLMGISAAFAALLATGAIAIHLQEPALLSWLQPRAPGPDVRAGLQLSVEGAGLAALSAAALVGSLFLARRARNAAIGIALAAPILPLAVAARAITPLAPRAVVEKPPEALQALPRPILGQADVRPRLLIYPAIRTRAALTTGEEIGRDIHETAHTNVAARFGYDVIPGFDTGDSALYRRFWEQTSPKMAFPAFVRLLGVDFAMVPNPESFAPGFPVLARVPGGWGIVGTFPVRPRAFVTPRSAVVASASEGLESLATPGRGRDPVRVVLSGPGAEALEAPGLLDPCTVRSPRPEEVVLDCTSASGGYAVLLDEYLPGWTAELDGGLASILTADGLFRAVRVGPGAHKIAFRYRTPGLRLGALISAVSLGLIAFAALKPARVTSS